MIDVHELAQLIARSIIDQGEKIDDLGDGESVCLVGELPTINLVVLAKAIIERLSRGFGS